VRSMSWQAAAVSGLERIHMDFQRVHLPNGIGVLRMEGLAGQLAGFPGGHEPQAQLQRKGAAEDEPPGFQAQDMGGLQGLDRPRHGFDGRAEGLGVRQKGTDIAKGHPRARKVLHFMDEGSVIHVASLSPHLEGEGG